MGLLDTHLHNSHGNDAYDHLKNVSTCNEIAKMSSEFMIKYDYLKTIVATKTYKV
jgi:D-alanyl-D-alanine carboxypeptidase